MARAESGTAVGVAEEMNIWNLRDFTYSHYVPCHSATSVAMVSRAKPETLWAILFQEACVAADRYDEPVYLSRRGYFWLLHQPSEVFHQ
jgi:hypothetical protein